MPTLKTLAPPSRAGMPPSDLAACEQEGTPRTSTPFAFVPALVALAAAMPGCAGGPGVEEAFQPPEVIRPGCGLTRSERIPNLERAVAEWAREWGRATTPEGESGGPAGSVVLSIQRDRDGPDGRTPWVLPMASELDDETTRELVEAVRNSLPEIPEGEPAPGYRLRVDLIPEPSFSIAPSLFCAPTVANRENVQRRLEEVSREVGLQGRGVLHVRVDPDGRGTIVSMAESTGHAELDRAVTRAMRMLIFNPGHIDGFGIELYSEVPVIVARRR